MFDSPQEIQQSLLDAGVSQVRAAELAALSKPCVSLLTAEVDREDSIPIGATKIGGVPDLPAHIEWPLRAPYRHAVHTLEKMKATTELMRSSNAQAIADGDEFASRPEEMENTIAAMLGSVALEAEGRALTFIAQINLKEIAATSQTHPDMPADGRLQLFYDVECQPWGFRPGDIAGLRLIFDNSDIACLRRVEPPVGTPLFRPLSCTQIAHQSPLSPDDYHLPIKTVNDPDYDAFQSWWSQQLAEICPEHQVGGHPHPIQNEMQTECELVSHGIDLGDSDAYHTADAQALRTGAGNWLLVLQIDSDEANSMMWGDLGRLYVWMTKDDLRSRRFDKARLILQCS